MIKGIGIDIVKVSRVIEKAGAEFDSSFALRAFTRKELEYAKSKGKQGYRSLAGFFAAREAFFKATQVRLDWQDVSVDYEEGGKPFFRFTQKALDILRASGFDKKRHNFHLSITHEGEYAVAVVVCESSN